MADNRLFSEDISGLWGDPEESALEPPRPNGMVRNGRGPVPAAANGRRHEAAADDPRNVARLAEALTGHEVDLVRHSELGALRAEMEDEFTQKLAVALYELLSASNERFSSVEDHMDRRLHDVAVEVSRVGDLVAAHNADAAQQSGEAAESGAALSQLLEGSELRAAESLEKITERMASVQSDLTDMQEALRELREEVSSLRGPPGAGRRWGRTG